MANQIKVGGVYYSYRSRAREFQRDASNLTLKESDVRLEVAKLLIFENCFTIEMQKEFVVTKFS